MKEKVTVLRRIVEQNQMAASLLHALSPLYGPASPVNQGERESAAKRMARSAQPLQGTSTPLSDLNK